MNTNLELQPLKHDRIQSIMPAFDFTNNLLDLHKPQQRLESVLMLVLPHVGSNEANIIRAEVMAALVVEDISEPLRSQLAPILCESIEADPVKKAEALAVAQRVLSLVLAQA